MYIDVIWIEKETVQKKRDIMKTVYKVYKLYIKDEVKEDRHRIGIEA